MLHRKSDSCVVPMKLGNSDGGKSATLSCPYGETFTTRGGRKLNGNKTNKDSKSGKISTRNEVYIFSASS